MSAPLSMNPGSATENDLTEGAVAGNELHDMHACYLFRYIQFTCIEINMNLAEGAAFDHFFHVKTSSGIVHIGG